MVGRENLVEVIVLVILDLLDDFTITVLLLSATSVFHGLVFSFIIEDFGRTGLLLFDCFESIVLAILASSLCFISSCVGSFVFRLSRSIYS